MISRIRLRFLPVFLTLLSVSFAVALVWRVRAFRAGEVALPTVTADATRSSAGEAATASGRPSSGEPIVVERAADGVRVRAVSREQRYRELLAMGNTPEDAAVKTAAEMQPLPGKGAAPPRPKSPIARLLQPIVNAVTGSKPAQPGSGAQTVITSEPPHKQPDEPKDPNSDTTPPQLLSVEFQPSQIHDGEETMLIINAVDDLSGIRGISGTLTSPSGKALQGFAQQRQGETTRYVSRITIPKDAEEGAWKISFLNLSDQATNMVTLSSAQGTIPPSAVLRVISSRSDSSPPTLRSVSIARRAMHSGESNTLFVEVDDDKSGVHVVSAVFVSPSKQARIGFNCKRTDGAMWECPMAFPQCLDCGDWPLEQIQMQDNANNYARAGAENPMVAAVHVNIAGNSCDSSPPVLQTLLADKSVIVIGQGDLSVTIRVSLTDDICGVDGVSGQVSAPGTNAGTYFSFSPEGGDTNNWVGTFRLRPDSPRGIWRVQSITVTDKGQNLRIYYATDPLLARGQFVVR